MIANHGKATLIVLLCFFTVVTGACRSGLPTETVAPTAIEPTLQPVPELPTSSHAPTALPSPTESFAVDSTATLEPYVFVLDGALTDVAYLIPLTLQHVGETSATLYFELSEPHEGALFFWDSNGPAQEVPFSGGSARYMMTLDGLVRGVEYWAVVGLKDHTGTYSPPQFDGGEWGAVRFKTFTAEVDSLRTAVVGDSGFGQEATYQLLEQMATEDLDFVIHTGDVVYRIQDDPDAPTAFAWKYYAPFAPILHRMPVYPVLGNHEVDGAAYWEGVPYYFHAFPPIMDNERGISGSSERRDWYAFSVGGYQFILLNSQAFYGVGEVTSQTEWLAERLRDERYVASIPVFHIAPYTSGSHTNDGLPMRSKWGPLFEQANVPLVLSGHDHNYERLIVHGITYVVSGGGSATLYSLRELHPDSKAFARRTHYVLLELYADRIELTSVALGGEILDRATIPLASK